MKSHHPEIGSLLLQTSPDNPPIETSPCSQVSPSRHAAREIADPSFSPREGGSQAEVPAGVSASPFLPGQEAHAGASCHSLFPPSGRGRLGRCPSHSLRPPRAGGSGRYSATNSFLRAAGWSPGAKPPPPPLLSHQPYLLPAALRTHGFCFLLDLRL